MIPWWHSGEESGPVQEEQETWLRSLGWEGSPGGGNDNLTQYSCLENSVDRGFVGYSPWGRKESDMTEQIGVYARTLTHTQAKSGKVAC